MLKEEKEFPGISSEKLIEIVSETLDSLESLGWKIKYKFYNEKNKKTEWGIGVPSEGFYDWRSRLLGAGRKFLKIEASNSRILVECKEIMGWGWLSIDFPGEKKRIINEFFSRINSAIDSKSSINEKR